MFAGEQLFLANRGEIELYDLQTGQRTTLVSRGAKHTQLTASRGGTGWLAVVFEDGALWRFNLATRLQNVTQLAAPPRQILVQPDGTVVFSEGRMLRAWRPTGVLEPLVELPRPIEALGLAGPGRAVAFAANGTGYVIELDAPNRHSEAFEVYVNRATISPDTGMMVTGNRGVIEMIDPLISHPHRWTLATTVGMAYTAPQISNDGRHVLARRRVVDPRRREIESMEVHVLLAWRLVMPESADDTARWLDQMTNAVVDSRSILGWR
jgi:hypothetical protein